MRLGVIVTVLVVSVTIGVAVLVAVLHAVASADTTAWTQVNLGYIAHIRHDMTLAMEMYQSGLVLYRKLGSRSGTALALAELGWLYLYQSQLDTATKCFVESLGILAAAGIDGSGVERALTGVSWGALVRGDIHGARTSIQQAVQSYLASRNERFLAECVEAVVVTVMQQRSDDSICLAAAHLLGAASMIRSTVAGPKRTGVIEDLYRQYVMIVYSCLGAELYKEMSDAGSRLTNHEITLAASAFIEGTRD